MSGVGRYRVIRQIGRGGMAEVLEAIAQGESGFERRVAIKRMLSGTEGVLGRMFLDEARIASRLHHAGIVAVLDYGIADGLPFQVLELVDGLDARRLAERAGTIPVEIALAICTEVAHALAHAHEARGADGRAWGIVHRDVKPANVLVSWSGDVKLGDFGIAFARDRAEETRAGEAKGTLCYMAPEQALRAETDARTDVFALGCVLHALIAGRSPLADENRFVDFVAGGELPLDPALDDDVRAIVARATRHARAQRWESAAAMASVLGSALARRIDRDPKTVLREWLDGLAPEPAPAPSRLDALLNVEMILAVPDSEPRGDVRCFETRTVAATPSSVPGPRASEARTAGTVVAPRPGRVRWLAAAIAIALAAGGVLMLRGRSPAAARAPEPDLPEDAAPKNVPVSVAPTAPQGPAPGAVEAWPPARTEPAADPAPPPAEPVRPGPAGTGFVVVSGEGALRQEVRIDGQRRGLYAPRKIPLPHGAHLLELLAADGRVISSRTIAITERHTELAPARWMVPASP